ncbi:MAG: hypothetical protein Q4E99_01740, partial [Bacillota bacterium]|nr:hypothetical protein [Bacillota bacterium]
MRQICTFLGLDHKCGTSMIAQSVAESISMKLKDNRILLIHTERDSNNIFSPNVGESMENIQPYLSERLIDIGEIAEKSRYKDNLYIIGGNGKPGNSGNISPDMSEYLLGAPSTLFDVIICDSGADFENGMSLGSIFSANNIYLVGTPSEATLRKAESSMSFYRSINLPLTKLIINKYARKSVNTIDLISKRLGFKQEDIFVIGETENGDRAEHEERS